MSGLEVSTHLFWVQFTYAYYKRVVSLPSMISSNVHKSIGEWVTLAAMANPTVTQASVVISNRTWTSALRPLGGGATAMLKHMRTRATWETGRLVKSLGFVYPVENVTQQDSCMEKYMYIFCIKPWLFTFTADTCKMTSSKEFLINCSKMKTRNPFTVWLKMCGSTTMQDVLVCAPDRW